jgi:hypothetical protein
MQGTPLDAHTRGPQDLPHPPIYYVLEITDSKPAIDCRISARGLQEDTYVPQPDES